jgi:hypothetical protein
MNRELLKKHIEKYLENLTIDNNFNDIDERNERKKYYQSFDKESLINMDIDSFYEYIGKLWAMLIWGNKKYKINQLIEDNGFEPLKLKLSELLYGDLRIETRWDNFKKEVKGFGPAMMSELLCYVHPSECMLWNRTAVTAYQLLHIDNIPLRNYQMNGDMYVKMTQIAKEICEMFKSRNRKDADLLFVDYFFWDQLRDLPREEKTMKEETESFVNNKSYHNEIIEYIKNIGTLLGYNTDIKGKVKDSGKIADAIWEFNVGNIGKIKYIFEVQDKGSIDSLIVSLMNASQDISVQAVVAVSDKEQINKIKQHCNNIYGGFNRKLKFWDIEEVSKAYSDLSNSMEIINKAINVEFDK